MGRANLCVTLLALALALGGCPRGETAAPAPPSPREIGPAAPSPIEGEASGEPVVDEADDVALDPAEEERARLETACFHGSTEACDRLGH